MQVLTIGSQVFGDNLIIAEVPGLGSLQQLLKVELHRLDIIRLPNFSGFRRLVISFCTELITLEGLEDLPALQCLELDVCLKLSRLPDLSKSTNLEELDLCWSGIVIYEETICMLAKLPLLRPVRFDFDEDHHGEIKVGMVTGRCWTVATPGQ